MSKTLVTGGTGFVGSNLAEFIESPVLLDWREPGYLFGSGSDGSSPIFDNYEFVHGDTKEEEDLEKRLDFGRVGSIIPSATIRGIKKCGGALSWPKA